MDLAGVEFYEFWLLLYLLVRKRQCQNLFVSQLPQRLQPVEKSGGNWREVRLEELNKLDNIESKGYCLRHIHCGPQGIE
eukprot:1391734-Amorphochlora_amoeboformis.AAC.1